LRAHAAEYGLETLSPGYDLPHIQMARSAATSRRALDAELAREHRVTGNGKITVDVNAPKGTSVSAKGGGIFKKTEVNRQTQMEPAKTSNDWAGL
jgi:hypothetical protein